MDSYAQSPEDINPSDTQWFWVNIIARTVSGANPSWTEDLSVFGAFTGFPPTVETHACIG